MGGEGKRSHVREKAAIARALSAPGGGKNSNIVNHDIGARWHEVLSLRGKKKLSSTCRYLVLFMISFNNPRDFRTSPRMCDDVSTFVNPRASAFMNIDEPSVIFLDPSLRQRNYFHYVKEVTFSVIKLR